MSENEKPVRPVLPESLRTTSLLGVPKTREAYEEQLLQYLDDHYRSAPARLSDLNRRFSGSARKVGTSFSEVVESLQASGRIATRFSAKFKRTYVYPAALYAECVEALQEGNRAVFDLFEAQA